MKEFFKISDHWNDVDSNENKIFQLKTEKNSNKIKTNKKSKNKIKTGISTSSSSTSTSNISKNELSTKQAILKNSPLIINVLKSPSPSQSEIKKTTNLNDLKSEEHKIKSKPEFQSSGLKDQKRLKKQGTLNSEIGLKSEKTRKRKNINLELNISEAPRAKFNKTSFGETNCSVFQNDLAKKLRETLKGGRFRFINEQLYKLKGIEAKKLFEQDLEAFASYHEGYRQQVEKWPFNPLNRMIKKIRKSPKSFVIADFGCGEANLSDSVPNKVYSIDLVAVRNDVIACDMANTPLSSDSIDAAVFCLSLMGTNLNEFLCEANRVLKVGGYIYIAEIASRIENVNEFIKLIEKIGFKLLSKDLGKNSYFNFFDFTKTKNCEKNNLNEIQLKLKPCIYKKR